MSRLSDLIANAKHLDKQLGADLEREVKLLQERREFGLNFERHRPEAVELYNRPIRKGDKVRILPPRGSTKKGDQRLWKVKGLSGKNASLELLRTKEPESAEVPLDDLVVVAEFKDKIFPGLVSTGKVEHGGAKPYHTVINGENFHVLKALTYTHRGKVDAIYIDPPYNTGAKDWKYNNDYVEGDDSYRHSKWLAFMERRLQLAKELLNPMRSVLVATIDEKEYLRLGLLLEQSFPEARIQMVSIAISPSGVARGASFRRTDEYAFFVMFGDEGPTPLVLGDEWTGGKQTKAKALRWNGLMRSGTNARRADRPRLFYPVYLSESGQYLRAGKPLAPGEERAQLLEEPGEIILWPIRSDASEGNWQIGPAALDKLSAKGYVKIGEDRDGARAISYLKSGEQKKVEAGAFGQVHLSEHGHIEVTARATPTGKVAGTQWSLVSHSAADHGSSLLRLFVPSRTFPFPKSLYAVEDCLRFFVTEKPNAVVLDFFSGSGTTAHAVMRLNNQDGGRRQCISVTNNEVAADEQRSLRQSNLRPGDSEWEKWGICDHITKPRIEAAITGLTPDGEPIKGDYKFTDEFPMSDGFEENAEFFTLTYESPIGLAHDRGFDRIAPLLWMRAGSEGQRIEKLPESGYAVAEAYGLLHQLDKADDFCAAMALMQTARIAFIVTDDERRFQAITRNLPSGVEPVRLYESYLRNFQIGGDLK